MVTQTYQQAAGGLLEQATAELDAGDVRQASEKGWGAASQMVKAVAELRGWQHRSHASLFATIDRLVQETGDEELRRLFNGAGQLHVNFYENWLSREYVQSGLDDVRRLLELLTPMAEPA